MTAEEAAAAAPEAPETTAPPASEAAEAAWAETKAARARTAAAENCIVMCVFCMCEEKMISKDWEMAGSLVFICQ